MTPGEWRADYRTVVDIWDPTSAVETTASFVVANGATSAEAV